MKALIYKEFKLSMHPVCYVFVIAFPLMILIPSYPIGIGFIYLLSCYPILFLGANKGQQSNDLLYSTLQPVRKRDIVLARIITLVIMQTAFMTIMTLCYPLARIINELVVSTGGTQTPGLPLDGYVSMLGIVVIGYAIADLIYLSIYYKNGKSILASTLLTILGFVTYITIFTIVLPYVPEFEWYTEFLCNSGIGYQFIVLGLGLGISGGLHYLAYKIASNNLDKVDF